MQIVLVSLSVAALALLMLLVPVLALHGLLRLVSRRPHHEARLSLLSHYNRHLYDLATSLARAANRVTLYLTHNGVLAARAGEHIWH